ncbi:MAG: hypothetical protein MZV70_11965 [Desulfobacterales bacterium]|nr:hypothetical protein [Desulfobacterales bacterium]
MTTWASSSILTPMISRPTGCAATSRKPVAQDRYDQLMSAQMDIAAENNQKHIGQTLPGADRGRPGQPPVCRAHRTSRRRRWTGSPT